MDVAKAFCIRFQPLAPHGPNKNPHLDDSFGGKLMKVNLKVFKTSTSNLSGGTKALPS
jgi:hypothetical protein